MDLHKLVKDAKKATNELASSSITRRNQALSIMADELDTKMKRLLLANEQDLLAAKEAGINDAMLDRLALTPARIEMMATGVRDLIDLPDPIGAEFDHKNLANGMQLYRRREPLGVIGTIYEARPNVTVDIAALCLKTANVSILRGGKETLYSNIALIQVIQSALKKAKLPACCVQYIANPKRLLVNKLLKMDEYIDMIIPRGGANLHKICKQESHIPVIIGGFGVSHLYVDHSAKLSKTLDVIINAKCHRPSACNSLDTLLVRKSIAEPLLTKLTPLLNQHTVSVVAHKNALAFLKGVSKKRQAKQSDFDTEWLDRILSIKCVDNVQQAIQHMQLHKACHSDAILTESAKEAEYFIQHAGSAAVYVNASTRFTDGAEFGLGAEVAVSTQKLHARGPMGLEALTTYKWVAKGNYSARD